MVHPAMRTAGRHARRLKRLDPLGKGCHGLGALGHLGLSVGYRLLQRGNLGGRSGGSGSMLLGFLFHMGDVSGCQLRRCRRRRVGGRLAGRLLISGQ